MAPGVSYIILSSSFSKNQIQQWPQRCNRGSLTGVATWFHCTHRLHSRVPSRRPSTSGHAPIIPRTSSTRPRTSPSVRTPSMSVDATSAVLSTDSATVLQRWLFVLSVSANALVKTFSTRKISYYAIRCVDTTCGEVC